MTMKSATDEFWNQRPSDEKAAPKVNISDTVQRDHELQFIFKHVPTGARMIEIGCGNGYVSEQLRRRVAQLDSFDFAENMIAAAKQLYGETNNRFFHDSVLAPQHVESGSYDVALCVRVLINLRDLEEQKAAVQNMATMLKPGGKLILVEGFQEGFDEINRVRTSCGLEAAKPAPINFYSDLSDLLPAILEHFSVEDTWHSGLFDFLTRVVYPNLVGDANASGPGNFHASVEPLVRAYGGSSQLSNFARLHGFALVKK